MMEIIRWRLHDPDEILSLFTRIQAVLKTLHKLYPAITCKHFHPDKARSLFQPTFTCSKLAIETLQQGVKYVQS